MSNKIAKALTTIFNFRLSSPSLTTVTCPKCGGDGSWWSQTSYGASVTCSHCGGSGKVLQVKEGR